MKIQILDWKILFLLLCFSISSCGPETAYTGAFAGETVNSVVDNFSKRIEDIINNLDNVISKRSFDIRQHLMILSDQLDYIAEKNIDKVFDGLTKQQRQLLINVDNSLTEFEKSSEVTLTKVEDVLEKTIVFAGTLPGSKRIPTITKVSPSYFSDVENSDIVLTIKGNWLATGEPFIQIDSLVYEPTTKIDNKLEFILPLNIYNDESKINLFTSNLTLFKKSWFKTKEYNYKVGTFLIPKTMGKYKLKTKVSREEKIAINRSQGFGDANGHCQGARNVNWTFNVQKGGWKIDPNSIKHRATSVSSKSKYLGLRNVSESGFQIHGRVENSGNCVRVLGKTVAKDARGSVHGTVSWQEYKMNPKTLDLGIVGEGDIFWGKDLSIELPQNTISFELEIDLLDGKKKIITSGKSEDWFKVDYNEEGSSLIIKPRELDEALN
ncbi:hypothetical protein MHTCC0001_21920 [Flavobacteriaceae bacterium MHTCC 0001]